MTRRSASRMSVPTAEITSDVRQPARFEKKTNTPPPSPSVRGGSSRLAALDEPDDQRRAQDGQDEAARATEEQAPDETAEQGPTDAHRDRHRDAHGIGPRDDQATQRTDDEAAHDEQQDETD